MSRSSARSRLLAFACVIAATIGCAPDNDFYGPTTTYVYKPCVERCVDTFELLPYRKVLMVGDTFRPSLHIKTTKDFTPTLSWSAYETGTNTGSPITVDSTGLVHAVRTNWGAVAVQMSNATSTTRTSLGIVVQDSAETMIPKLNVVVNAETGDTIVQRDTAAHSTVDIVVEYVVGTQNPLNGQQTVGIQLRASDRFTAPVDTELVVPVTGVGRVGRATLRIARDARKADGTLAFPRSDYWFVSVLHYQPGVLGYDGPWHVRIR